MALLVYICKEVLIHGVTGKKRICGKRIESLYQGQFQFWKAEHMASHLAKKEGITTQEALTKVRTEDK